MQIQTFSGRSLAEALGDVKRELGEDAIILSSRRAEDPSRLPEGHSVEVVAAIPATGTRRAPAARKETRAWAPPRLTRNARGELVSAERKAKMESVAPVKQEPRVPEPAAEPIQENPGLGEFLELKEDMLQMRRALRDVNRSIRFGSHAGWKPEADDTLRRLDRIGLSRSLACQIIDELPSTADDDQHEQALQQAIARRLPCNPELPVKASAPRILAFVGPTGVGKTTALIKLLLSPLGLKAGRGAILSLDTKRIAAVEQIRRLSALARIRTELVYKAEDLPVALDRLSGSDWILVDTPGAGPSERLQLERTRSLLRGIRPHQTHLVLAANMSLADQLANVNAWKDATPDRLLITKLDEASACGSLLDLAERADLPFLFGGCGQTVSQDLLRLDGRTLAKIMLEGVTVRETVEAV